MSERERYARQVRERLGKWGDGELSVMQCIDRVVARADIAEQEKAELIGLLSRFRHERHVHQGPVGGGDVCDLCGRDIRHDIHYRLNESGATDRAAVHAILTKHSAPRWAGGRMEDGGNASTPSKL